MATEAASCQIVREEGPFELRDYGSHVLAETSVEGDFEDAGCNAGQRLYRYTSGANKAQSIITMTAPVSQTSGETIGMTAPVGQQKSGERWVVNFRMPASYSMETPPVPDDPQVSISTGSGQAHGFSRIFRFLERKERPAEQVKTGGMDAKARSGSGRRSNLGTLQPTLFAVVYAPE